ncbi:hypothetical protein AB0I84_26945 [Streptomyces spectabilis]|uniref:hypothetical protein n=1 Tax=Streptomyces spectabilis TaxID=68270 RepID=UPI0033D9EC2E
MIFTVSSSRRFAALPNASTQNSGSGSGSSHPVAVKPGMKTAVGSSAHALHNDVIGAGAGADSGKPINHVVPY